MQGVLHYDVKLALRLSTVNVGQAICGSSTVIRKELSPANAFKFDTFMPSFSRVWALYEDDNGEKLHYVRKNLNLPIILCLTPSYLSGSRLRILITEAVWTNN